jgi:hypothetical protein
MKTAWMICVMAVGCASTDADRATIDSRFGDARATSVVDEDGITTALVADSGTTLATMMWSRETHAAEVDLVGVATESHIDVATLTPERANELLYRAWSSVPDVSTTNHTSCEGSSCGTFTLDGMDCAACAVIHSDCSVTTTFWCGALPNISEQ